MMKNNILKKFLHNLVRFFPESLISVFLLYSGAKAAEDNLTTYQVELILFEQPLVEHYDEIFPEGIILPKTAAALEVPLVAKKEQAQDEDATETPVVANEDNELAANHAEVAAEDKGLTASNLIPAINEQLKLGKVLKSIEDSAEYRLIGYFHWQQKGLDDQQAFNIHIHAGFPFVVISDISANNTEAFAVDYLELLDQWMIYRESLPMPENTKTADWPVPPVNNTEPQLPEDLEQYLGSIGKKARLVYELDGTVKLVRTRFLHFYTNLVWNEQIDPLLATNQNKAENSNTESGENNPDIVEEDAIIDMPEESALQQIHTAENDFLAGLAHLNIRSYLFKSHRKMKSRQQHYIDHPKVGLIIEVTPVMAAEKQESSQPQASQAVAGQTDLSN